MAGGAESSRHCAGAFPAIPSPCWGLPARKWRRKIDPPWLLSSPAIAGLFFGLMSHYALGMAGKPIYDPEEYMPRIFDAVSRGELLLEVAKKPDLPSRSEIYRELLNERWRDAYARARELQAHAIAEKAVSDVENTRDDANMARLKFDARRWLVGKIAPRIYGDKIEHKVEVGESYIEALRLANDRLRVREREARRIIDVDPHTGNEVKKIGKKAVIDET